MQLPLEKKNLTIQEAADALNVRRERIWKLVTDGVLTAVPSKLDGRQKLIPREQVENLLLEEGYRPRRTARRMRTSESEPASESTRAGPRPSGGGHGAVIQVGQEEGQRSPESFTGIGDGNGEGRRRLPRTVGAADDDGFQASESENYMH